MFTVVIIDDEKANLDYLLFLIGQTNQLICKGVYDDSILALKEIKDLSPDLLLLDIEIPLMNGLQVADEVKKISPHTQIVFTTAYREYAVDAFKINALHYLLKPISVSDFDEVIHRLNAIHQNTTKDPIYKIRLFGGLVIENTKTGRRASFQTKKTEELFAYFLYKQNQPLQSGKISDMLWPDSDMKSAQHNLHNTIYRIRKALNNESFELKIEFFNGCYKMNMSQIECDVYEFERFLEKQVPINETTIVDFEMYFARYTGDVLQDYPYEWIYVWQQDIRNKYWKLTLNLVDYYLVRLNYPSAEEKLLKYLGFYPLDENAFDHLMGIYYHTGNRSCLITSYQRLKDLLLSELDVSVRESTQRLYKFYVTQMEYEQRN